MQGHVKPNRVRAAATTISLRHVLPADLPELGRLLESCGRAVDLGALRERLEWLPQSRQVLVLESGGHLQGASVLEWLWPPVSAAVEAHVTGFWLDGGRFGAGLALPLLDHVCRAAFLSGAEVVIVRAAHKDDAWRGLLCAAGFEESGVTLVRRR